MKYNTPRAQGTIEYLVIIAIVVVISLVVVSLLLNLASPGQQISQVGGKINASTSRIGITNTVAGADGNFTAKFSNNTGELIKIISVSVDGNTKTINQSIPQGSNYLLSSIAMPCIAGATQTYDIIIIYESANGLSNTQRMNDVIFNCESTVVVANPSQGETGGTPPTVPGTPTGLSAVAGDASATVAFSVPSSNGGSPITGYSVTSSPAGGTDANAGTTALTHMITSLSNGTPYTFTATATNAIGTSVPSLPSNSVTPNAIVYTSINYMEYDTNTTLRAACKSGDDFNDNFSGNLFGVDSHYMQQLSGTWTINSGALYKLGGFDDIDTIDVNRVNALNGTVEAKVILDVASSNYNGIIFRSQGDSNYYFAVLHPDWPHDIKLIKRVNGIETDLNTIDITPFYITRNLKVVYNAEGANGVRIKMYMDGALVINHLDSPASLPNPGSVGVRHYYNYSNSTSYDDFNFRGTLATYPESTIKQQGNYSLKVVASDTNSLNESVILTMPTPVNLSGKSTFNYYLRTSRTGANIKVALHDTGGTTTIQNTPNIVAANTWQQITTNISAVPNQDKDAIDQVIITVVNADAANTFYIDDVKAS